MDAFRAAHDSAERVSAAVTGRLRDPQHEPQIAAATERGWRAALLEHAVWCEQMAARHEDPAIAQTYRECASQAKERAR